MTSRSAVFRPIPGTSRQPRHIAVANGPHELAALDARQNGERQLRSNATDANQPLEQLFLERRHESEELQRVLAHMRVDPKHDRRAGLADGVEGRQRHEHVVADAADVDNKPLDVFFEQRARQTSDHGGRAGLVRPASRAANSED